MDLFTAEQEQLLADLYKIPSRSCGRKVGTAQLVAESHGLAGTWLKLIKCVAASASG